MKLDALPYPELRYLCDHRLGTCDVACPLCGPHRRDRVNRKSRAMTNYDKFIHGRQTSFLHSLHDGFRLSIKQLVVLYRIIAKGNSYCAVDRC